MGVMVLYTFNLKKVINKIYVFFRKNTHNGLMSKKVAINQFKKKINRNLELIKNKIKLWMG